MAVIDMDQVYKLNESGAQVDKVTGLPYKSENMTTAEKQKMLAETAQTLIVTLPSFSSLPQTVSNSNITASMVVVNSVLSNPSAQISDWTVNTAAGSLTVSGSISGATTLTLYLAVGV